MHVASCFFLKSLLDFQEQEQQHPKKVPVGHGPSFGLDHDSWPLAMAKTNSDMRFSYPIKSDNTENDSDTSNSDCDS